MVTRRTVGLFCLATLAFTLQDALGQAHSRVLQQASYKCSDFAALNKGGFSKGCTPIADCAVKAYKGAPEGKPFLIRGVTMQCQVCALSAQSPCPKDGSLPAGCKQLLDLQDVSTCARPVLAQQAAVPKITYKCSDFAALNKGGYAKGCAPIVDCAVKADKGPPEGKPFLIRGLTMQCQICASAAQIPCPKDGSLPAGCKFLVDKENVPLCARPVLTPMARATSG